MLDYALARLREPSTYAGLAGLAAALGVAQPLYEAGAAVVMALAGLAAILLADKAQ